MFSAIRKRVTPATAIATIALVFAMSGGAYAASKYVITSTKQISPKVLKSLQGKAGKNGAAGPAGIAGAQGAAGPAGAAGAKGESGAPGTRGETGSAGSAGSAGPAGAKGAPGSPWTAGGTLPSKATETGAWSFGHVPPNTSPTFYRIPISFPIPLSGGLSGEGCETVEPSPQPHVAESCQVHFINVAGKEAIKQGEEVTSTACTGSVASPTATAGNLCVYTAKLKAAESFSRSIASASDPQEGSGTASAGAYIKFEEAEEESQGWGTWAVTAE
jgi:Collagen triple helix repeat (20 copies)